MVLAKKILRMAKPHVVLAKTKQKMQKPYVCHPFAV